MSWRPKCARTDAGFPLPTSSAFWFLRGFFAWYNTEHRHSALGWMTPATVHHGEGAVVHARRAQVLAAAYARHPERFGAGPPQPPALPERTWINPPEDAP